MALPFEQENGQTALSASVAAPNDFDHAQSTTTAGYSRGRKIFLLVTMLLSWMLANADRIAMTIAIIPITKELALDAKSAGYVLSAFYVSYALMQLGGGWLADRFGSRSVLVGCVTAWSVFTGLTGAAGSLVSLLVIRFLFGIGEGAFNPASSVAISEAFPKHERARAKALIVGAIFIGGALGTGSIAALIHHYGWRVAYHVLGSIGIAMALVLSLAVRKARPRAPGARSKKKFRPLLRMALMRKTMLIYFFSNIVLIGLISWMPTFLVKTRHIDVVHAGFASAVPYVVAFVSLNAVGALLDKFGRGRERLFFAIGGVWLVVFLGLMTRADSVSLVLTFWTLSMVGSTIVYGTVWAIPLAHLPDDMVGTGSGILNFGGQLAAAVAPAAIGLLVGFADGSFTPAFLFLIGSGVALILVALTWRAQ
jgi:MFS transporter, ACS family, hexuronate transporter